MLNYPPSWIKMVSGFEDQEESTSKFSLADCEPQVAYNMLSALKLKWHEKYNNGYPTVLQVGGASMVLIESNPFLRSNKKAMIKRGALERTCARCRTVFQLNPDGTVPMDYCTYHLKNLSGSNLVPCCGKKITTPGCMKNSMHVFDGMMEEDLDKFVYTPKSMGDKDHRSGKIYAIDCEMGYTNQGMSLIRVSVLNLNGEKVMDEIVKPDAQMIDANTKYSGVTMLQIEQASMNLEQVQKMLFELINEHTILVGHGLENDLKALRLFHPSVVDTAVLFNKNTIKPSLKSLTSKYLNKLIQNDKGEDCYHDSIEDAMSCVELLSFAIDNCLYCVSSRLC